MNAMERFPVRHVLAPESEDCCWPREYRARVGRVFVFWRLFGPQPDWPLFRLHVGPAGLTAIIWRLFVRVFKVERMDEGH